MTDGGGGGELSALCLACGLCCDGSLFGRVPLAAEEVEPARRRRLDVVANGRAFEQPCSALRDGGGGRRPCAIHDARPAACRAFVCRLHERHRREGGPLEPRLAIARRARALLALAPREGPLHDELVATIAEHFARA